MPAIDFISGCRGEPCRAGDVGLASGSCVSRRFQIDDNSALVVLRYETGRCVRWCKRGMDRVWMRLFDNYCQNS
jgi:hypothetical protein